MTIQGRRQGPESRRAQLRRKWLTVHVGVDVGTTSKKAVAFDGEGRTLAEESGDAALDALSRGAVKGRARSGPPAAR